VKGELDLLVYGKPVAIHVDPIEKKPLYHFLPGTKILSLGTFGCNFRCEFCQNWEMSQNANFKLQIAELETIEPKEIVKMAIKYKTPSIAYTYNEPTIFVEYAHDIMVLARKAGLKNVFVSNGYESMETWEYIGPYLDAINIDLKSFSDEFYKKQCGARLQPVLDSIKECHRRKIWQEITTLLIPDENDSDEELKQIAEFIASVDKGIPWHISRFHPDYKMLGKDETSLKSLNRAKRIGKKAGLKFVYLGNVFTTSSPL
jgi:pyruvate formate lyase activating enzyme